MRLFKRRTSKLSILDKKNLNSRQARPRDLMMPVMGLGMATTTMVGHNLRRDLPGRSAKATWASIVVVLTILLAGALIAFVVPEFLVRIFITDPKVVKEGVKFFRLVSFSIPFAGILQVMMEAFRGTGHTMYSVGFTIVRLWLFRLPLAYILGAYLGWASEGYLVGYGV